MDDQRRLYEKRSRAMFITISNQAQNIPCDRNVVKLPLFIDAKKCLIGCLQTRKTMTQIKKLRTMRH